MEFLPGDFILNLIGKSYLHLRFQNKGKVQQELTTKYEGHYSNAGRMLLADAFMSIAVVALICFITLTLYVAVK